MFVFFLLVSGLEYSFKTSHENMRINLIDFGFDVASGYESAFSTPADDQRQFQFWLLDGAKATGSNSGF